MKEKDDKSKRTWICFIVLDYYVFCYITVLIINLYHSYDVVIVCYSLYCFLRRRERKNSPIFISKDGENTHTVVCGIIITRPTVQYILQWVCWSL